MSGYLRSDPCPVPPFQQVPPRIAVLIPVFEPTLVLEEMIERLVEFGAPAILVVDDCSGPEYQAVLDRIAEQPTVHLLRHCRRQGRGTALKTGMLYFLDHLRHYIGVVTADAHGQHTAEDVLRVARALNRAPRLAILGARAFEGIQGSGLVAPKRLIVANRVIAYLFRAYTGVPLSDAQTGLRGLPASLVERLVTLPGSGYEYEMAVLLYIARSGHPLAEQPIRMVCGGGNWDAHFRPLADSWRVLCMLMAKRQVEVAAPQFIVPNRRSTDVDNPPIEAPDRNRRREVPRV